MAESGTLEAPPERKFGGPQEGSGRPKGTVPPSELLKAMRHVFEFPKELDKTEMHAKCRRMWEKDEFKYAERLALLEKVHRDTNEKSQERAAARNGGDDEDGKAIAQSKLDDGEKRVRELIGMLLKEAEKR